MITVEDVLKVQEEEQINIIKNFFKERRKECLDKNYSYSLLIENLTEQEMYSIREDIKQAIPLANFTRVII